MSLMRCADHSAHLLFARFRELGEQYNPGHSETKEKSLWGESHSAAFMFC